MHQPLALALCLSLALSGCSGGCGDDAPAPEPSAPPAPAGLVATLRVQGTDALLRGLAEQSQSRAAAALLPKTAGDLAGRLSGMPPALLDELPVGAAMHLVVVQREGGLRAALAVALPAAATLSAAIPKIEGGPHGSQYLFERPGPEDDAQARAEGAVVWAPDAALLEELLPYALAGLPEGGAPTVRVTLPEGVAGGALRGALERRLDAFVASARQGLAAERAAHDAPPPYGDPEPALDALEAWLRAPLAYLPDLGRVTATLSASPTGTELDVALPVREGSPLADALAAAPVGPAYAAAALPPSSALALMSRAGEAGPPALFALLRAVAGERLRAEDGAALAAAEAALRRESGAPSVTVLGGNRRGAFLAHARPAEGGPADPAPLEALVEVPYLGSLLGAALGCPGPAAPAPRQDHGPLSVTPLCAGGAAPYPTLLFRRGEADLAFALSHRPDPGAAPHPAVNELLEGLAGHTEGLFGGYPDAARALEILDERTLLALALEPSRLFAAAALLDIPALRALADRITAPPTPAPIIVGLSRSDEGLRLRARAAPRALDRLLELGLIGAQLLGGEDAASAP